MTKMKNSFMAHSVDNEKVSQILKDAADKYIRPRFGTLKDEHVYTKTGPNDLVTIADQETEAALEKILPTLLPGSMVLGEEAVAEGRISTDILDDPDNIVWVVDPVDGTYNFRHGREHFGMIVALVAGGEVIKGWIYDIPGDRMMIAEKGAGTTINGQKYSVPQGRSLSDVSGFVFAQKRYAELDAFEKQVKSICTLRCAAHEYFHIVEGKADFSISNKTKPWDHLAGTLAVREAGGIAKLWGGDDYNAPHTGGSLLTANSDALWQEVYQGILRYQQNAPKPKN
jgi:fructose-1,6-bisphosphatase/inositol monophosphatase family enzyme